jgi:hypothetical protein
LTKSGDYTQNSGPGEKKCTIAAVLEVPKRERADGHHALEKQISSWSIHCSRNDGGYVSSPQRRFAAGRLFGAVSHDGRGMGDFRVALRETEITLCSTFRVPPNRLRHWSTRPSVGAGH